ncbi:NADP-dependent malic enzyme [Trifolium repens]|nr:NADP-dependent malic enzyme [Trifolium repens]
MGLRLDSGFPERIRQREGKGLLQTKAPIEESRKRIWLVDSKKPWAHEYEPVSTLIEAIKVIKPTVRIGSSGLGITFTKEVVEAMAANNKVPLILALSNSTSQSECTAEEAYTWSEVK